MPEKSESRPLTSIMSYPERGEGGNNRYRGNCSPKLVEDLIGFFPRRKSATICVGAGQRKLRRTSSVSAAICTICTADLT